MAAGEETITRQLKPTTSKTTQQSITSIPDMQCTSHLSALMVLRSRNTKFQRARNLWVGEGQMAESFENFRIIRRQNLQHMRRAHRHLESWTRRVARSQNRSNKDCVFQEVPDSESSHGRSTSESDSDDFDERAFHGSK